MFLENFGGPQGIAIAKLAQAIQGVGYIYFAFGQKTLVDQVTYFIEGFSQLLSVLKMKIKVPGLSDWVDRIAKYASSGSGFQGITSKLIATGTKINKAFDAQPKWLQVVVTYLADKVGSYITQGLNWIIDSILTPLFNLINKYNSTLANYIKTFIDYMKIFLSLIDTASLIVTDLDEKGILTKVKTS